MDILKTILWVVEIISAVLMIVLVLLQHGKGAEAGATFGSGGGSSGSLFGASGSANFLSRTTAILAAIFFLSTFGIVVLSNGRSNDVGVMASVNNKAAKNNDTVNTDSGKLNREITKANEEQIKAGSSPDNKNVNTGQKNQMPN